MTLPATAFEGVSKRYGSKLVVNNLELTLPAGGVTALLGPNGAGKTTALSMLIGLSKPTTGTVRLFGRDPVRPGNRRRLGTMLQTIGAPDTLTVGELVRLYASFYDRPLGAAEVTERADLGGLERLRFGDLSGGQARRVAFALAICGNPDVLVLDEPSAGLDLQARRLLWRQIRAFAQAGRTVVLSTHHLEEADALADRVIVMHQGVLIADGTPQQLKARVRGRRVRCRTTTPVHLLRAFGVTQVDREGQLLTVRCQTAEPLVRFLLAQDPDLADLEVSSVSLEEAFAELTRLEASSKPVHPLGAP